MLARGQDQYGHFDIVQPPSKDHAFGENPNHAQSIERKRRNLLPDGKGEPGESTS
jgi:hypothetical protein